MKRKVAMTVCVLMCITAAAAGCNKKSSGGGESKPESLKFDFGLDKGNTVDGWTAVTVKSKNKDNDTNYKYSEGKGYGFLGDNTIYGKAEAALDPAGEKLDEKIYLDGAIAKGETFAIDVENGYYTVQLVTGTKSDSTTTAKVEGVATDKLGETGKYTITTIENVNVKDGQLTIQLDGTGTAGGMINAISVSQVDVPKNLKGEADSAKPSVSLTWDASEGAEKYNVYRKDRTGKPTLLGSTKELKYTDTTAEKYETYSYYVTGAVDTGAESAGSDPVEIKLIDSTKTAPTKPQNVLVSTIDSNKTTITWDKVDGAVQYAVYTSSFKGTEGNFEGYELVGKVTDATITYEGSTFKKRYYKVIAANEGGFSEYSLLEAESGMNLNVQLEYLDRNAVAIKVSNGVYVGWKLPIDEYADGRQFELYRDNTLVKAFTEKDSTNFVDSAGTNSSIYCIKAVKDGTVLNATDNIKVNSKNYYEIPIQMPKAPSALPKTADNGTDYSYTAGDCSVADMDGDGVYEYIVKWDPTENKDNAQKGYTGEVFIDCYKIDGTLMWRICLGKNIRAGAHYTQLDVYDYDGDGHGELILKTADGTIDGKGKVIGDGTKDYRNSTGYVLTGPEYLTLFDGMTGEALDTIDFNPARGNVSNWGDGYGNRVDRFLGCTAYLDGVHPSAIVCRGYYTRAVITAYDVVDKKLKEAWVCDSNKKENASLAGQGAHYATAADIDQDGFDEIVYGSGAIDHDGKLMYTLAEVNKDKSGGHGDAIHVGDFDLNNPGLEIFMVHEGYPNTAGIEMHDAATGKYLYQYSSTSDIGRGACDDIDPNYLGCESWAPGSNGAVLTAAGGKLVGGAIPVANFLIWWDGDLGREILDHSFSKSVGYGTPIIQKWDWKSKSSKNILKLDGTASNNWTKGNPCLQADVLGDWREEVVVRTTDNKYLRIYTTTDYSEDRIYTLMHDPQYRVQVASQNCAYNQPPHTSFYIGFDKDYVAPTVRNANLVKAK